MTRRCTKNNMQVNAKKSMTRTLSNTHNNFAPEPNSFNMNGEVMSNKHDTKFLGVVIDTHLTFQNHFDHLNALVHLISNSHTF